jgi:hypothetical protein
MMHAMRTTVTLDADVEAQLRSVMRERGVSFKVAINDAIRAGLTPDAPAAKPFRVQSAPLGVRPGINLDKALALAGEMEDAEIIRKLELGK